MRGFQRGPVRGHQAVQFGIKQYNMAFKQLGLSCQHTSCECTRLGDDCRHKGVALQARLTRDPNANERGVHPLVHIFRCREAKVAAIAYTNSQCSCVHAIKGGKAGACYVCMLQCTSPSAPATPDPTPPEKAIHTCPFKKRPRLHPHPCNPFWGLC